MLLACMPIHGETASYRRSSCLDIKNSCSNFTHDHAPRAAAAAAASSVAHFQTLPVKKKKREREPFMRNNVPATMSPSLLPPLLERYY